MALMTTPPLATTSAGTDMLGSFNSSLNSALDVWLKVEQIKGAKAASGQDQVQAKTQPEYENGAMIQLDSTLPSNKAVGVQINQPLLIASLGLLAFAFLLRSKGFS